MKFNLFLLVTIIERAFATGQGGQLLNKSERETVIRSRLCNARTCSKCVRMIDMTQDLTKTRPCQKRCIVLLALDGCCANNSTNLQ